MAACGDLRDDRPHMDGDCNSHWGYAGLAGVHALPTAPVYHTNTLMTSHVVVPLTGCVTFQLVNQYRSSIVVLLCGFIVTSPSPDPGTTATPLLAVAATSACGRSPSSFIVLELVISFRSGYGYL